MKITAWNIEGRLSAFAKDGERGSPGHIVSEIERLDSDVLFLPEAFDASLGVSGEVRDQLGELGYDCFEVAYNDRGDREFSATIDPHVMLLSRLPMVEKRELPLVGGIRTMLAADIIDPDTNVPVHFFGIHLDDRSEEKRLLQVDALAPLTALVDGPTIALGDFNATHGRTFPARFFGNLVMKKVTEHFPHHHTSDTLRRVSEMAIGETLRRFEAHTSLTNVDPKYKLTITPKARGREWLPPIPLMKIDHIYISPELQAHDYQVERDGGSDHRAISATITLA